MHAVRGQRAMGFPTVTELLSWTRLPGSGWCQRVCLCGCVSVWFCVCVCVSFNMGGPVYSVWRLCTADKQQKISRVLSTHWHTAHTCGWASDTTFSGTHCTVSGHKWTKLGGSQLQWKARVSAGVSAVAVVLPAPAFHKCCLYIWAGGRKHMRSEQLSDDAGMEVNKVTSIISKTSCCGSRWHALFFLFFLQKAARIIIPRFVLSRLINEQLIRSRNTKRRFLWMWGVNTCSTQTTVINCSYCAAPRRIDFNVKHGDDVVRRRDTE